MTPAQRAFALFEKTYGMPPAAVETAPGRVNLIGEHTDYNGGLVLPMAIPQQTAVALRLDGAGYFRAVSEQFFGAATRFDPASQVLASQGPSNETKTSGTEKDSYLDYLRGACQVLADAGFALPGVDLAITSDVPVGSGLSSSAALLVATLRAVRAVQSLSLSDFELACFAHRAEFKYVGVPVGVMDPMASSLASVGSALFLNSLTLAYERVPFPNTLELAVVDSGQQHEHASGEYGRRRAECEQAAAALGAQFLCELDEEPEAQLQRKLSAARLSDRLCARVLHVTSENQRVKLAVAALRRSDGKALGALLNASHASLRDQFEVSTPEIDALVASSQFTDGCFGARMTGGGFGGSIVILTQAGEATRVANAVVQAYNRVRPEANQARVMLPLPSDGDRK